MAAFDAEHFERRKKIDRLLSKFADTSDESFRNNHKSSTTRIPQNFPISTSNKNNQKLPHGLHLYSHERQPRSVNREHISVLMGQVNPPPSSNNSTPRRSISTQLIDNATTLPAPPPYTHVCLSTFIISSTIYIHLYILG